jgi:hypothetical protein
MVETRSLNAHDPLPDPPAVVVMRRFDEDDPRRLMVEVIVSYPSGAEETSRPVREDGSGFMDLDEAIAYARSLAQSRGLAAVHVVDRTAGPRESAIITHDGDHSIDSETLDDMDLEDGEKGPDMRDIR